MSDFDSNPFADPEAGNPFAVSNFKKYIFANIIMIIDLQILTAGKLSESDSRFQRTYSE